MSRRYATIADVIDQDVTPALGEFANEYDAEAIASAAYTYRVDSDGQGRELLNTAGFELAVDDNGFWAIVEQHAKPGAS